MTESGPSKSSETGGTNGAKAKVVIISLRFNPAFLQFLAAYAKAVRALDYDVAFLLDPEYRRFPEIENTAPVFFPEAISEQNWSHAIFLNPSVSNREAAAALRRKGVRILYIFHEPWQLSLRYLSVEGPVATIRGFIAHRATVPVLKLADSVMIPSQWGLKIYQRTDARFNPQAVYMPLIMDDEAPADLVKDLSRKQYFGFIGALNRSHAFDQYVAFMRRTLSQRRDLRFLIASRNPLPAALAGDPIFRQDSGNLEIRCGRPLDSDEMNQCYADCFCIWNIYRRSTQSGVLPKAFMFGAPVLATQVGAFPEFVREGVNGRFARPHDGDGIWNALTDIRANLASYATNCRRTFLDVFYYESQIQRLDELMRNT